jgi:hypothetical protein
MFSEMAGQNPEAHRLCVLDFRAYPFLGSRRQFQVCQPVLVPSYPWLLDYLREQRVTEIAVQPINDPLGAHTNRYRWAYVWLREHPEAFSPLAEGSSLALFRVDLSQAREQEGNPDRHRAEIGQ